MMQDTKTQLLDCALDLIQRVGVNAMSYNDLSKAVGIRKASIHYHFPRKDDMLVALLSRCKTDYRLAYRDIADSANPAPKKLEMIVEMFEETLRNDKMCVVGMLSAESESLSKNVQEAIKSSIAESPHIFTKIMEQGIEEKSFSADQAPAELAYGFLSLLLGAQIVSRCTRDTDVFCKSATIYIALLRP